MGAGSSAEQSPTVVQVHPPPPPDTGIPDSVSPFANTAEDADRMVCVRSGGEGFCC